MQRRKGAKKNFTIAFLRFCVRSWEKIRVASAARM